MLSYATFDHAVFSLSMWLGLLLQTSGKEDVPLRNFQRHLQLLSHCKLGMLKINAMVSYGGMFTSWVLKSLGQETYDTKLQQRDAPKCRPMDCSALRSQIAIFFFFCFFFCFPQRFLFEQTSHMNIQCYCMLHFKVQSQCSLQTLRPTSQKIDFFFPLIQTAQLTKCWSCGIVTQ